jgi:hypothetical protein
MPKKSKTEYNKTRKTTNPSLLRRALRRSPLKIAYDNKVKEYVIFNLYCCQFVRAAASKPKPEPKAIKPFVPKPKSKTIL